MIGDAVAEGSHVLSIIELLWEKWGNESQLWKRVLRDSL